MDLDQLNSYLAVVEAKSINKAAESLGVPRSTVRRHVDALEIEMGEPLLVRVREGTTPTERGLEVAAGAQDILRRASSLRRRRSDTELVGEITVAYPLGLPADVNGGFLLSLLSDRPGLFARAIPYEGLDRGPIPEADLIVVMSIGPPPEGPFRTFVVARLVEHLIAHPSYLEEHGHPRSVEELKSHRLLSWRPPGEDGRVWTCCDGRSVEVNPAVISDEGGTLRWMAENCGGIARVFTLPEVAALEGFVLVLPELFRREVTVRALLPEVTAHTPRTRLATEVVREFTRQWVEEPRRPRP